MKSKNTVVKTLLPLMTGCLAMGLLGCPECKEDVCYDWQNPAPAKLLETYHKGESTVEKIDPVDDSLQVYQDFSDGFQEAWKDANSMEFYKVFAGALVKNSTKFYVVGEKSMDRIDDMSQTALFARVTNPKNYNRNYAALDSALNKIVAEKKRAVFVTDGELFTKNSGESEMPWARNGFAQWLKAGNKLSFFVTDFIENKKKKHVFYMIFTPASEVGSAVEVAATLEYALKSNPGLRYDVFHFQNNSFSLKKGFDGKNPGSFDMDLAVEGYAFNAKNNWEYADITLGWADIHKYFVDGAYDDNGKPIEGGRPLIGRRASGGQPAYFALDASQMEFYAIKSVSLNVYSIYDDFYPYALSAVCAKNPREMKKSANGEVEIDPSTEMPVVLSEGEPGCYNLDDGSLLSQYSYSPKPVKKLTDVFVLNKKHFFDTMSHNAMGEIEIQVAPNFDGKSLSSEHANMLKLELVIDSISPDSSLNTNEHLNVFKWEGQKLVQNNAMYHSVIHALRDAVPQSQVLFTWYVKTRENDF